MLSENPEEAKTIIMCDKPTISEDSGHLEPHLLDTLIDNISMLSSVYYRPPETFAKKVRDRINERLDLENDDEAEGAAPEDYVDSMGVKKSDYIQENQNNVVGDYGQAIEQDLMDIGGGGGESTS